MNPTASPPQSAHSSSYWKGVRDQKDQVLNVRAEAVRRRSALQHAIARIAGVLSHPAFFLGETVLHLGWIAVNSGLLPGVKPWDPYPFSFLTGMASVQALFIGLLILMYAEHDSHVSEVRQEMELQVALHAERESSKLLRMLAEVHHSLGIRSVEHDHELEVMAEPLDPGHLRETTEERLRELEEG